MLPTPALILSVVFVLLGALHFYWAFGGTAGLEASLPTDNGKPLFQPGKFLTLFVAVLLLAAAALACWRGVLPNTGPAWIPRIATWVFVVIFGLRAIGDLRYCGFFKRVRGTTFSRYDSLIFSPLCATISALALWLALSH